ncbi:MAG: hypothetical protein J0I07_12060 [Myxococcales bacterium]|nr:hypothetical protein [Myxococcales bacterium]
MTDANQPPRMDVPPGPTALCRCLWGDASGAVYVEFIIAFMPVFVFFLCLLQLALLFSSQLLVEHSAVQGARAAAVVFGDEPGPYGEHGDDPVNALGASRRRAVRDAVLVSLAPLVLDGSIATVDVAFPHEDAPGGKDQPENAPLEPITNAGPHMIRVRVEADVVCKIAMANAIMCNRGARPGLRVTKTAAESLYPYQGARYAYE